MVPTLDDRRRKFRRREDKLISDLREQVRNLTATLHDQQKALEIQFNRTAELQAQMDQLLAQREETEARLVEALDTLRATRARTREARARGRRSGS